MAKQGYEESHNHNTNVFKGGHLHFYHKELFKVMLGEKTTMQKRHKQNTMPA